MWLQRRRWKAHRAMQKWYKWWGSGDWKYQSLLQSKKLIKSYVSEYYAGYKSLEVQKVQRKYLRQPRNLMNLMLSKTKKCKANPSYKLQKEAEEHPKTDTNIVALYMSQEDVQHMARTAPDTVEQIMLSRCAQIWAEEWQDMVSERSIEKAMTHDKMLRKQEVLTEKCDQARSKVFNFHCIWSIIIAKLKTKTSQRTELCKYKIDTGSVGNLLSIRMFKGLYPSWLTICWQNKQKYLANIQNYNKG